MIFYHGSEFELPNPVYGKRKPYSDYSQGFYCTENIELRKLLKLYPTLHEADIMKAVEKMD